MNNSIHHPLSKPTRLLIIVTLAISLAYPSAQRGVTGRESTFTDEGDSYESSP